MKKLFVIALAVVFSLGVGFATVVDAQPKTETKKADKKTEKKADGKMTEKKMDKKDEKKAKAANACAGKPADAKAPEKR